MDRGTYNFTIWCHSATRLIRYGPDRKKVHRELMAHLEDCRSYLMEQGASQEEASEKALEAMGSAEKLAPQLAAIHKPFWGYVIRTCQILLVALLIVGFFPIRKYFLSREYDKSPHQGYPVYSAESYGGDTGRTLHHISQPNVSFSSDGSTFTITDAVVYTKISPATNEPVTTLCFLVEQSSLLPRREHQDYQGHLNLLPITSWFYAVDNTGRRYDSFYERDEDDMYINTSSIRDGVFSCTIECWINDFEPEGVKWVDICYERDGRNYTMRINLTGGGTK